MILHPCGAASPEQFAMVDLAHAVNLRNIVPDFRLAESIGKRAEAARRHGL